MMIGLVGPLPPPAGGMATQCQQLERLLMAEGIQVRLVQTNAAYQPNWIGSVPVIRAAFRLMPYLFALWHMAREVAVVHLMANSGWAWHLFAAPAIWIGRLQRVPVIVNYRGGNAAEFLSRAPRWVKRTMMAADARIVPSRFLQEVFAREGIDAQIIPNVIDTAHFKPKRGREADGTLRIVVTRNLERIYDIGTALQAFAMLSERLPNAILTIAGEGPERASLEKLAKDLHIADRVTFAGLLDRSAISALYGDADLMLNPSTVDNMPNSMLEAFAAGVPVVSTNVGGIPHIARDGETALLVPPRSPSAMAEAAYRVLTDRALSTRLRNRGLEEAQRYTWTEVRNAWLSLYRSLESERPQAAAEVR